MNIKFIKDSNTFKSGALADVEEMYSRAFIAMGFAEEVKEDKPKAEIKDKPKAKTTTKKTAK